ncbi:nuclear transport factor 2 family protein [Actinophytocola sp.]|uniref:nuclear transport factor 2 family protein n=1 Tax=Actinophytocola sp. TaxID=1872138 RepID=UPI003D6A0D10
MTTTELNQVAEQRAREYYRKVDLADLDAVVELFSSAVTYQRPGYPTIHGHGELLQFYRDTRIIDDGEHTVDTVVVDYPRVAVNGRFEGRLRSGELVSLRFADFFEVGSDGRFTRRDTFFFAPLV